MSIASEITRINTNIENAYTACNGKGATMPVTQNSANLATCIGSIPTGGGGILETLIEDVLAGDNPVDTSNLEDAEADIAALIPYAVSTTKTITANGTYVAVDDNANGYSSVTVNVSGGSFTGINREVVNGVYTAPTTSFTWSLPSGATDLGTYVMYYAFMQCAALTGVLDLSSLTTVSGGSALRYAFYLCPNLTSVDLSSLTTVSGSNAMTYAFYSCTGLTSVDLSSLTTVSGSSAMQYAFGGCTGLTSVDLSSLTTVSGNNAMQYAFGGCTGLTSVDLSSLTTVSGSNGLYQAFYNCTGLTSADLSSLTTVSGSNAMQYAFGGCTGLTSVLFTNLQMIGQNTSTAVYSHFTQCFNNCNNLTSITFPKLEKIYCTGGTTTSYGTFANNNKVQKLYFPKLDTITYGSGASSTNQNACKNIFYGCAALTELHFGSANQSAIEASPGYSTAWGRGAGNVTIYFDL